MRLLIKVLPPAQSGPVSSLPAYQHVKLAPQKEVNFSLPVKASDTFGSIWARIEERYTRNYLPQSQANAFVIKKLQDIYGFDLDISDSIGDTFGDPNQQETGKIIVVPAEIDREASIPLTSNLRPNSAHKRHLDAFQAERSKRPRLDLGETAIRWDPHRPINSREVDNAPSVAGANEIEQEDERSQNGDALINGEMGEDNDDDDDDDEILVENSQGLITIKTPINAHDRPVASPHSTPTQRPTLDGDGFLKPALPLSARRVNSAESTTRKGNDHALAPPAASIIWNGAQGRSLDIATGQPVQSNPPGDTPVPPSVRDHRPSPSPMTATKSLKKVKDMRYDQARRVSNESLAGASKVNGATEVPAIQSHENEQAAEDEDEITVSDEEEIAPRSATKPSAKVPPQQIKTPHGKVGDGGKLWSEEDDRALINARKRGLTFSHIAQDYFPGRTPKACGNRYNRLEKEGQVAAAAEHASDDKEKTETKVKRQSKANSSSAIRSKHVSPIVEIVTTPSEKSGQAPEAAPSHRRTPEEQQAHFKHRKEKSMANRAAKDAAREEKEQASIKKAYKNRSRRERKEKHEAKVAKITAHNRAEERNAAEEKTFYSELRSRENEALRKSRDETLSQEERDAARNQRIAADMLRERMRNSKTPSASSRLSNLKRSVSFHHEELFSDQSARLDPPSPKTTCPPSILKKAEQSVSVSLAVNGITPSNPGVAPPSGQGDKIIQLSLPEVGESPTAADTSVKRRLFGGDDSLTPIHIRGKSRPSSSEPPKKKRRSPSKAPSEDRSRGVTPAPPSASKRKSASQTPRSAIVEISPNSSSEDDDEPVFINYTHKPKMGPSTPAGKSVPAKTPSKPSTTPSRSSQNNSNTPGSTPNNRIEISSESSSSSDEEEEEDDDDDDELPQVTVSTQSTQHQGRYKPTSPIWSPKSQAAADTARIVAEMSEELAAYESSDGEYQHQNQGSPADAAAGQAADSSNADNTVPPPARSSGNTVNGAGNGAQPKPILQQTTIPILSVPSSPPIPGVVVFSSTAPAVNGTKDNSLSENYDNGTKIQMTQPNPGTVRKPTPSRFPTLSEMHERQSRSASVVSTAKDKGNEKETPKATTPAPSKPAKAKDDSEDDDSGSDTSTGSENTKKNANKYKALFNSMSQSVASQRSRR